MYNICTYFLIGNVVIFGFNQNKYTDMFCTIQWTCYWYNENIKLCQIVLLIKC